MPVHFLGTETKSEAPASGTGASRSVTGRSDHSRDANPGGGQDFTGLVVAVQLCLRVAFGLQALQRCSGLLNRRARGSTVAAHHFKGAEVRLKNSGEGPRTPRALAGSPLPSDSPPCICLGISRPSDLRALSLPGANPGAPTSLRSSSYGSADRRVVNRE